MKKRLAQLQSKLDGAIKAYREHIETDAPTDEAALKAYNDKTNQLKAAMDAASQAVTNERAAMEAERTAAGDGSLVVSESAIIVPGNAQQRDARLGFRSVGDFFNAVFRAGVRGGDVDERLISVPKDAATPTTFGNETTGADGGYLVPPEFARTIYQHSLDEGSFLPLCDELPISGNSITIPKDETTPWGTNGIRMFWQGEATAAQERKLVINETTLKLRKMIGLVPMTDELLQDAIAGAAYVTRKFGTSMAWKTNYAIVNGPGGNQPLGFANSGLSVNVAAEGAQTADTIVAANCSKMLGRLLPASAASSSTRWLINNDALPQLPLMTVGNQPIWTPPNSGFKDAPFGFLLGRPIVVTQLAASIGDVGDIQLIDFKQWLAISKAAEVATSMHLYFDSDAMAFRIVFRLDGAPWLSAPVTPNNGSNTLTPHVRLAAR